jgi:hypothetical protein
MNIEERVGNIAEGNSNEIVDNNETDNELCKKNAVLHLKRWKTKLIECIKRDTCIVWGECGYKFALPEVIVSLVWQTVILEMLQSEVTKDKDGVVDRVLGRMRNIVTVIYDRTYKTPITKFSAGNNAGMVQEHE